jgi:hypothetical protein
VTTVMLAGAGAVGVRAGRQLVDTPGVDQLLVSSRDADRAQDLARVLGGEQVPFGDLPTGVDAVAAAVPGPAAVPLSTRAVAAGISVAAVSDDADGITGLLALDSAARDRGVQVVVGCALVPGLADVLARHAADALDRADEAHLARAGAAGESCAASLRRARRDRPVEWSDGERRVQRRVGPELVWFPDPIGARECITIATGVETLHQAVPTVERATVRAADVPSARRGRLRRHRDEDDWGAARVEVWGWHGETREAVVYGVIERPAVAAGTALAVAAARVAGALPEVRLLSSEPGARGLGAFVEPAPFLAELARRGVKAAAFEGVAAA